MNSLLEHLLTVLGWFAAFWFGNSQQKKNLKNEASMRAYEELYKLKKEVDEVGINLSVSLSGFALPFFEMEQEKSSMSWKLDALQHWNKYLANLSQTTSLFTDKYLKFWSGITMWIGVMPDLKLATRVMFEEQLKDLTDNLRDHHRSLQQQSIDQFDWTLWDKDRLKTRGGEMDQKFTEIAVAYLDDFMNLIHNELVAPIFGHEKRLRDGFANMHRLSRYKVLTKEGMKEVVRQS